MDNELLRKEKYTCEIESGTEGLQIFDLFIRSANNSLMRPVVLQKGEQVPTDLIDFDDLKKSRLSGALLRCIKAGWISVENPATELPAATKSSAPKMETKTLQAVGITEKGAGLIDPKSITGPITDMRRPKGVSPFPEETESPTKELISSKQSRTANTFAISENSISEPSKYEEFEKNKHFIKLKVIKETSDKDLLKQIVSKSQIVQLRHNAQLRLQELEK